ncbi:phage tail tape measure protein [Streptomyces sp. NPDC050738]|uniref:phage tail tape measure protein n=1 Tax=Streptomyces sp. NPDC050738 TaxID=3154744 RepID=UPI003431AE9C
MSGGGGGGLLPPVVVRMLGDITQLRSTMREARAQVDGTAAGMRAAGATAFAGAARVGKSVSLIGLGVAAASVKMAGDFEAQTMVLHTAAGETLGGLKTVRAGILGIAKGTGTDWHNLTEGMYQVEKAGIRGADGLKVLRAAAQGAREENASLESVTNAMTSVMASYHLKASDSVQVMNAMKTAAGEGKMTMEEFAASLSTVLPIASANKVGFAEVSGALATLTQHGTSAREGTQELGATIRALAAPNNVAVQEMQRLGLSSTDVAKGLADVDHGGRGLSGTFDMLSRTVLGKMGPAGTLLLSSFNQTKQASANLKTMLSSMPAPVRSLASQLQSGSISVASYGKEIKKLPDSQYVLGAQFKTLYEKSHGFSAELKRGGPAAQTYTEAMKKMLGGAIGLNTSLQLTGENTEGYNERVKKVGESLHHATKDVEGWDATQQLFNVRLAKAKQTVSVLAIEIGTKLLPVITAAIDFFGRHKDAATALAAIIGGVLLLSVVAYAAKLVMASARTVATFGRMGVSAVQGTGRIVQGFRSAQVAQSSFSGRAGSFGGILRRGWNAGITGAKSMGRATLDVGKAVGGLAARGGRAALSSMASGARSAAGAMRAAGAASLSLARSTAIATAAAVRSGVAWAVQRVRIIAAAIAEKAATVAQWLLNAAMSANPIMLVVLAIAALVAGFIWAYTKVGWFHDGVNAAFHGISVAVGWVVDFVKAHWPLLLAILTGPIGIAVLLITKYWSKISGAFTGAYHTAVRVGAQMVSWVAGLPGRVLSAMVSLTGLLGRLASAAWGRFLAGSKSLGNSVLTFVRALPGRMRGGLGSLGGLLVSAGADMLRGLLRGIRSINVSSVLSGIAHSAANSFKSALGISSPSKVFRSLGIYINTGLVDGLTGSTAKVKAATKRIESLMIQTRNRIADLHTSGSTKSGRSMNAWVSSHLKTVAKLEAYAKREDKVLRGLAAKRDSVATKLKAAQAKLAALQKSWTDERNSIASSIMQGTSVVTAAPDESRAVNASDVVANMQAQVQKGRAFAAELDQLRKKGLSSELIAQIAGAGVEQGGATALALSSASSSQIKQVNAMQASLKSAANATGSAVADSMYGAGIKSAQGLVKGLASQEKAINAQMARIAKQMAAAIKKALKIKSPSRVFSDIGAFIPQGLAQGVTAAAHYATTAASTLASQVTSAGSLSGARLVPAGAGALPGLGAGRQQVVHHHHVTHVNVEGSVLTEKRLVDVVEKGFLQRGGRNPSTYAQYKR